MDELELIAGWTLPLRDPNFDDHSLAAALQLLETPRLLTRPERGALDDLAARAIARLAADDEARRWPGPRARRTAR